jgi:hypothetical protein
MKQVQRMLPRGTSLKGGSLFDSFGGQRHTNVGTIEKVFEFLMKHPLVVLDPGVRWTVSGVLVKFCSFSAQKTKDGIRVSADFEYKRMRVSSKKWNGYKQRDSLRAKTLESVVENVFKALRDKTHSHTRPPDDLIRNLNLDGAWSQVVSSNAPLQQEELRHHQRELSLKFVRRIQEFTQGFGDPLVVIGDQGCGGMGREQVSHKVLLNTLKGFFIVIPVSEYNTSKKTTCCHKDALCPRRLGRSRGCNCSGHVRFWDRDTGASFNMLTNFVSQLITGERPLPFTRPAKTGLTSPSAKGLVRWSTRISCAPKS